MMGKNMEQYLCNGKKLGYKDFNARGKKKKQKESCGILHSRKEE